MITEQRAILFFLSFRCSNQVVGGRFKGLNRHLYVGYPSLEFKGLSVLNLKEWKKNTFDQ